MKGGLTREVLEVRRYKAGYEVRTEKVSMEGNSTIVLKSAYNPQGDYIGNSEDAYRLVVTRGIAPEKAHPTHGVCSIGYCKKKRKWYGWSHRAIFGFGIGHVVKKGDCVTTSGWTEEYLKKHPEENKAVPVGFKARTLEDCKRLAIAFAESVS